MSKIRQLISYCIVYVTKFRKLTIFKNISKNYTPEIAIEILDNFLAINDWKVMAPKWKMNIIQILPHMNCKNMAKECFAKESNWTVLGNISKHGPQNDQNSPKLARFRWFFQNRLFGLKYKYRTVFSANRHLTRWNCFSPIKLHNPRPVCSICTVSGSNRHLISLKAMAKTPKEIGWRKQSNQTIAWRHEATMKDFCSINYAIGRLQLVSRHLPTTNKTIKWQTPDTMRPFGKASGKVAKTKLTKRKFDRQCTKLLQNYTKQGARSQKFTFPSAKI